MNKQRRDEIRRIINGVKQLSGEIEKVKSDEEFAFDGMPENLQSSERGEKSEESIEIMDEVISLLDEVEDKLDDILL